MHHALTKTATLCYPSCYMETILDAVVCPSKDQVSCDLEGEAAILNLKAGLYYGLDAVGASAWRLARKKLSIRQVRDALLEEYEVSPRVCEKDLIALLKELERHGLVEIS